MLKNYLKTAFRSLAKNKISSSINILGLALAVGCCLVVFAFFDWSMHTDNFHSKVNNLFVVEKLTDKNGDIKYWGTSPSPLGPMLKADFPQIKNVTRVNYTGVIFKQNDNVFRQSISFVDDAFYKMFDFPIKWGDKEHFVDQDGIVLTNELSEKFFGKENPVGKTVNVMMNNNGVQSSVGFIVKGVFEKRPLETSFYFDALVPYSKMISMGMEKPGDWKKAVDITFVEAENEAALKPVYAQSNKYLQLFNSSNPDDKIAGLHFQPLNSMSFHAYKVINSAFNNSTHIGAYIMLLFIGISTLILVYFNYMNIAIAAASTRLKEIGVRKVMGSNRKQIIIQFILENFILCIIAVLLGLFLARILFLPLFDKMGNSELAGTIFNNYRTWVALLLLAIVSALSGAAYPSIYISSFKPINIIKGNSKMGSRNRFRKGLLAFQFLLTFLAIAIALAFVFKTNEIKKEPWGYHPSDNLVVTLDKSTNFNAFRNELKMNNQVLSVTGAVQQLGNYTKQLVIRADATNQTVQSISVLPGFATQLGINIIKGRDLSNQFATDQTAAVLVNQAFLKQMHWTTGIGKNIEYQNRQYTIVGETNDFRFENFQVPVVAPIVLMGCSPEEVSTVYIKTSTGLFSNAHSLVEKIWKKTNPDLPFDYYYQDKVFDGYFSGFTQVSQVMTTAAIIMMVISIFGVFGLALLILDKKMKEISVRKVLGADMGTIIFLINREFLFALVFGVVVGFPLSWWMTRNLFDLIAPGTNVSIIPMLFSFLSLIIMMIVSVSWHIYSASIANPTKYLRNE